jgi:hypothetical protein
MAWSNRSRLSGKTVKSMFRMWRRPPLPDPPFGVPKTVMRALAQECLPPQRDLYTARLRALMETIAANGRK